MMPAGAADEAADPAPVPPYARWICPCAQPIRDRRNAAFTAFAGHLIGHDEHFEWTRRIDLHPPGTQPDAGTLQRENDLLVERDRHADYVEHWQPEPGDSEPVWARDLVDAATGTQATLLRLGSRFGWVRGRRDALEEAQPLDAAIDAAPSLDAARRGRRSGYPGTGRQTDGLPCTAGHFARRQLRARIRTARYVVAVT
jgi:hypothetical protein